MTNERFQRLLREARAEMDSLNIPYAKYINYIEVNTRAKGRWGQCKKRDGKFSINLSSELLKTNSKAIKDTIIHELIHTVDGCFNHGQKFQFYANLMNKNFGYSISRVSTLEEKGFNREEYKKNISFKYTVKCDNCGIENHYQRKAKIFTVLERCVCSKCKSHGKFTLTQNY